MKLERQHIFEDILGDGTTIYHSAILTSYSFDPFFYSHFFKPQLCTRGISNQIVLIDASRLDDAKEDERYSYLPGTSLFEGYTPIRVECLSGGVFHPKIGFFIGRKRITAVIGSGNLTYSGMSYNDEAWCSFSISSSKSQDVPIIAAVWAYLKSVIGRQELSTATMQVSWMFENSELLHVIDSFDLSSGVDPFLNGEHFVFAANSVNETIFDRLVKTVGNARVRRVTICAPFFDSKGLALKIISEAFASTRIDCLVHPGEGTLPTEFNLKNNPDIHFYEFDIDGETEKASVHAKLIQLQTDKGTVLALGSANASIQALGRNGNYGNDEADIFISTTEKRDYLKDLGITVGKEVLDLTKSRKEEKADEGKSTHFRVSIRSCELLEDGIWLYIGKGCPADVEFHFVDDFRKVAIIKADSPVEGKIILPADKIKSARTVFIMKDRERISNKCVVLIHSEIEKKNPDRETASIGNLIEKAKSGEGFEDLLSHVHIEEETRPKMRFSLSSSGRHSTTQVSNKVITDNDFENKVFRDRLSNLEKVNDQILDCLARLIMAADEDFDYTESSQDENVTQSQIDQGVPEEAPLDEKGTGNKDNKGKKEKKEKKEEKEPKVYTAMDEARGFFKKLIKYYDSLSWKQQSFKENREAFLIKKPCYIQEKSDLSYSTICIAVYEMCKIAKKGRQDDWEEMIDYFITIVGEYLLLYRAMPSNPSDMLTTKMARKHRNLVVFSLLLLSFWDDYGYKRELLKLLTLNLFDSYRDSLNELDSVISQYEELLEKKLLLVEEGGKRMINECYSKYLAFKSSDHCQRQTLNQYTKSAIIYRPSFGFIFVEAFGYEKVVKSVLPMVFPMVSCTAIAPGFPDRVFEYGSSARGMIGRTSIQKTAIVLEKH